MVKDAIDNVSPGFEEEIENIMRNNQQRNQRIQILVSFMI